MSYWYIQKNEIWKAIELIEDVLEDYDEDCGLAFETVDEDLEKIKNFFERIYKSN